MTWHENTFGVKRSWLDKRSVMPIISSPSLTCYKQSWAVVVSCIFPHGMGILPAHGVRCPKWLIRGKHVLFLSNIFCGSFSLFTQLAKWVHFNKTAHLATNLLKFVRENSFSLTGATCPTLPLYLTRAGPVLGAERAGPEVFEHHPLTRFLSLVATRSKRHSKERQKAWRNWFGHF